jgi:hypothetical protein
MLCELYCSYGTRKKWEDEPRSILKSRWSFSCFALITVSIVHPLLWNNDTLREMRNWISLLSGGSLPFCSSRTALSHLFCPKSETLRATGFLYSIPRVVSNNLELVMWKDPATEINVDLEVLVIQPVVAVFRIWVDYCRIMHPIGIQAFSISSVHPDYYARVSELVFGALSKQGRIA